MQEFRTAEMDAPVPSAFSDLAPLIVTRPARQTAPLVFASAHSGRAYPPELLRISRLDPLALRRSEDSFVEELFASAPNHGAPLIAAIFPRAFCDANREAWELDPAMFEEALPPWVNSGSPRVSAGLGTIARVVSSGEPIYRHKLPFAEAERRVRDYWTPFHGALDALVAETRQAFGGCLLIDCHSMPAISCTHHHRAALPGGRSAPVHGTDGCGVVLGDAFGTACSPRVSSWMERRLRLLGFPVRRNDPYAGGYITRHYGRPREGVHTLQVEINRSLYMDEATLERAPGFGGVQDKLDRLIADLAAEAASLIGLR